MELDTLYYFAFTKLDDNSEKKGEIKMIRCNEALAEDKMEKSKKVYLMKLNLGYQIYIFSVKYDPLRKK